MKKKMSIERLRKQVETMQAEIKKRESPKPTGKVTLEFLDSKGNKLRAFKGLDPKDAFKLQRDLYKLIVTSMKQKISMRQVREYEAS